MVLARVALGLATVFLVVFLASRCFCWAVVSFLAPDLEGVAFAGDAFLGAAFLVGEAFFALVAATGAGAGAFLEACSACFCCAVVSFLAGAAERAGAAAVFVAACASVDMKLAKTGF